MTLAGSPEFTYYDILALSPRATEDQIRLAYREQARYYHPDVTQLDSAVAAAKLKIINEAYETLKDPDKRRAYDLELLAYKEAQLWSFFPAILELLAAEQCKPAFEKLKELQGLAPDSDMVKGLLATTFHLQSRLAFDAGKHQTARKFVQQALAVQFDDSDFRNQLQADLALVDQLLKEPVLAGTTATLSNLGSHDPVVLTKAVQHAEATDQGPESAQLVPELLRLAAHSPFREVRIGAIRALIVHKPDGAEALRLLVDLYTLTKKTRTLSHQLEQDKAALLKKLGRREYADVAPLLCPLAWEGTEAFRRGVVDAIGETYSGAVAEKVMPMLFSGYALVRHGAALALDKIEGHYGVADRLKGLVGLESEEARFKRKLAEIKGKAGKKVVAEAERIATFWDQPAKRGDVIRAWLKEDTPANLIEYLLVSLIDKRGGVHEVAREAFVRLGAQAVGPLCSALRDEDWLIRKLAAEILGDIRHLDSMDPLLAALDDPKPLVVKAAAYSLGELRDQKAIYPLLNLLKHEDPMVSDAAQAALNRIRGQTTKL
ncbi:MAG: HEAT repeat domain-containing protein [Candidatus Sericytochromatia bacterium]|nr:HEAT repeat domain-containing protein [Candidatus Tanganyikabacteria bacterium]